MTADAEVEAQCQLTRNENDPLFKLGHGNSQGFPRRCLVGVEGDPMLDPVGLETVCCFPFESWLKSFAHRGHRIANELKKCAKYIDMVEGGYEECSPLLEDTDDRDDDDDDEGNTAAGGGNETTGSDVPRASSTPNGNQRQTTMNRPGDTPSWAELIDIPGLATTTFTSKSELDKEFPKAEKPKLKYKMDDKDRLQIGLINPSKP